MPLVRLRWQVWVVMAVVIALAVATGLLLIVEGGQQPPGPHDPARRSTAPGDAWRDCQACRGCRRNTKGRIAPALRRNDDSGVDRLPSELGAKRAKAQQHGAQQCQCRATVGDGRNVVEDILTVLGEARIPPEVQHVDSVGARRRVSLRPGLVPRTSLRP